MLTKDSLEPDNMQSYTDDPTKKLVDELVAKLDAKASIFSDLKKRLEDLEIRYLPVYTLTKLWLCVDDGEFTDENALALAEKIKPLWPLVRRVVSPERLALLHQTLCEKGIRVEISHAFWFMWYCCQTLAIGQDSAEKIVTDGVIFAKAKGPNNHLLHPFHQIIEAVEQMKSIYPSTCDEEAVKAMRGNNTNTLTLEEICERGAHTVDASEKPLLFGTILSRYYHEMKNTIDVMELVSRTLSKYAFIIEGMMAFRDMEMGVSVNTA